jgi:hypothetical protein
LGSVREEEGAVVSRGCVSVEMMVCFTLYPSEMATG